MSTSMASPRQRPDRLEQLLLADRASDRPGDGDGQAVRTATPGPDAQPSRRKPYADVPEQHEDEWDVLDGVGAVVEDETRAGRHRAGSVPLVSVPGSLRSVDVRVGARAVRGLLVLVVVAVLVLGGRYLWTQRAAVASPADRVVAGHDESVDESAAEAAGVVGGASSDGGAHGGDGAAAEVLAPGVGGAPGPGTGPGTAVPAPRVPGGGVMAAAEAPAVVVHVTGQVAEPGVVTLPGGSRVVDAVRASGGLTGEADQSTLNLARLLVDGEQVWVGRPGEQPPPGLSVGGAGVPGGAGGQSGGSPSAAPPLVNINVATQAELEELPGIGPVTAGHILSWRETNGAFTAVDELLEVSGIGERTLAQLEPLVTVGG